MKFNRIHHIAIICSDYVRTKKFYTEILGLEIIKETFRKQRDSYKLDLGIGGEYIIELFSFPNPPKRVTNPEAVGLRHLAFEVDNIESTIEYLSKKGVVTEPIRIDDVSGGRKFTFFRDPDDLPIEIYQK